MNNITQNPGAVPAGGLSYDLNYMVTGVHSRDKNRTGVNPGDNIRGNRVNVDYLNLISQWKKELLNNRASIGTVICRGGVNELQITDMLMGIACYPGE